MSIVGYMVMHPKGTSGEPGLGYTYLFSGSGVYISAESALLCAAIPVSECVIRGLVPAMPDIRLVHGKIPQAFFDLALNTVMVDKEKERYLAITWKDGSYHLFFTGQEGGGGGVKYKTMENTILDIHSHTGDMGANFSSIDNADEQGFRMSLVIGKMGQPLPQVKIRLGVYGYFHPLAWADVFEGKLTTATEEILEEPLDSQTAEIVEAPPNKHWWSFLRSIV